MTAHPLDAMFHPRGIAIAGISSAERERGSGPGGGGGFLTAIREMGFSGGLYPVNPKATEIQGLRCYPSVSAIPGEVDYVISSVPAPVVPSLVQDCIAKGVGTVHFFTAGFSETGDEERSDLERQAISRLQGAGIRVIGPNCMGLYVPASGLSFMGGLPTRPGTTAFISQSGANAGDFIRTGAERGVYFSKVISYGNAAGLKESDFFDYAAEDDGTDAIFAYIEGVREGRRFVEALRRAARQKPVAILKGGRTSAGARAAASHTGSLAGTAQIFDALCRQAGALRADSLDDLADLAVAFRFITPPASRGIALVGAGGGTSVLAADAVDAAGLTVPPLPDDVQEELRRFVPIAGTSIRNPLDVMSIFEHERFVQTLRLPAKPESIGAVLFHTNLNWGGAGDGDNRVEQTIAAVREAGERSGKPVVLAFRPVLNTAGMTAAVQLVKGCAEAGIAVFPGIDRAARALAALVRWREMRERSGEGT